MYPNVYKFEKILFVDQTARNTRNARDDRCSGNEFVVLERSRVEEKPVAVDLAGVANRYKNIFYC